MHRSAYHAPWHHGLSTWRWARVVAINTVIKRFTVDAGIALIQVNVGRRIAPFAEWASTVAY
jgi:hypothetical protein